MHALLTSAAGDNLRAVTVERSQTPLSVEQPAVVVHLDQKRQTLYGIGGALTQASAAALLELSPQRRAEILEAYFSPEGAAYSLNRTHIASCDFSTESYTYAPNPDPALENFSIAADRRNGHLDLIRDAQAVPGASFRLIASPWTAPPWMKDNNRFFDPDQNRGGTLLDAHLQTFSDYFVKYLKAYQAEGIDIWALTPVNEPHGNNGTWESMEMTPEQQRALVGVLRSTLDQNGFDTRILIYDQNRVGMQEYAAPILGDPAGYAQTFGTAVHWYDSTFRVYEDELDAFHAAFPERPILQIEGCVDNVFGKDADRGPQAALPWWQDDGWYWRKEATDWGWDWLDNPEDDHPPYAPAFRYARDIVGGLAHWLAGWTDWNIVLDKRGGPNHVGNFCLAPILVDGPTDTVYYTPLFFIMKQISRSTRPGAVVFATTIHHADGVWATALENPDGQRVVHLFNETAADLSVQLAVGEEVFAVHSPKASLMTLMLP